MKTRVKELIEETVKTTLLEYSTEFVDVNIQSERLGIQTVHSIPVEFCEKFAELIIQECIAQVKLEQRNMSHLLTNPPQNGGVWDARNNIRRRFGIE